MRCQDDPTHPLFYSAVERYARQRCPPSCSGVHLFCPPCCQQRNWYRRTPDQDLPYMSRPFSPTAARVLPEHRFRIDEVSEAWHARAAIEARQRHCRCRTWRGNPTMTERRDAPYLWVSWLAKLMAGETRCQWSVWFKVHHKYQRVKSNFDLEQWKADHERAVDAIVRRYVRPGEVVRKEQRLQVKLTRRLVMAGKPDLVVVPLMGQ